MSGMSQTTVLVVGAGVVGLTLGMMFASNGIEVTVCDVREEKKTSQLTPQLLSPKAMEIFGTLGLADIIESESEKFYNPNGGVLGMETLTSGAPSAIYIPSLNLNMDQISPQRRVFLTQHMLMRILRAHAKSLPLLTLRYNCGVVDLTQDETRVIATTTLGKLQAKYCISTDGDDKVTREFVTGNRVTGRGVLANSLTIVFRADLRHYSDKAYPNALTYVTNSNIRGLVRLDRTATSGMLVVYTSTRSTMPENGEDRRVAKARLATQLLKDAIGRKEIYTELVTGEDWTAKSESADRLCNGRTFLVGDAARKMAPIAGFAENTGIADACNLLWKILFVLSAKGTNDLLESYHAERHPVGLFTVDQAYSRWKSRCANPVQGSLDAHDELPDINLELGFRYNNSKAVVYIGGAKGSIYEDPFWPTAFPGGRAPHVWLGRPELEKPLFNHIESGRLVLFCSAERGQIWVTEGKSVAANLPLKVSIVPLGDFFSKYRIKDNGAVLVRPDGVIAWKALSNGDAKKLESVVRVVLGLEVSEEHTVNGSEPNLTVSRANSTPSVTNDMKRLQIVDNKESKRMSTVGGLMRRMTTMRGKKPM